MLPSAPGSFPQNTAGFTASSSRHETRSADVPASAMWTSPGPAGCSPRRAAPAAAAAAARQSSHGGEATSAAAAATAARGRQARRLGGAIGRGVERALRAPRHATKKGSRRTLTAACSYPPHTQTSRTTTHNQTGTEGNRRGSSGGGAPTRICI